MPSVHYTTLGRFSARLRYDNAADGMARITRVLPRIPEADTVGKWEALLPWNVKAVLQKAPAEKF